MRPILALVLTVLLLPVLAVCNRQPESAKPVAGKPIRAIVSIPPLKGLVEPLLPEGSAIDVLIPPGVSEHGYEIPPSKMASLAKADLVVCVGLGLEPQVEKFLKSSPAGGRQVVWFASAAGISGADNHDHGHAHDHDHGHDHDHDHAHAVDPHLWLDPVFANELVSKVAVAIGTLRGTAAVSASSPPGAPGSAAVERHRAAIERIDAAYREELGRASRRTILVAHDAYGWLAKRYNLEVVAISGLAAAEPTPAAMAEATRVAREKGLKIIFVEPQLGDGAGKRIAEATGLRVRTLDPLGDGDWFKMMRQNLEALKAALVDEGAGNPVPGGGEVQRSPAAPTSPSSKPAGPGAPK